MSIELAASEVSYKLNYATNNNNILILQGLWVIFPIQTRKKLKCKYIQALCQ